MRSTECSSQGVWQTPSSGLHPSFLPLEEGAGKQCSECVWVARRRFPRPSEWTNFPKATIVSLFPNSVVSLTHHWVLGSLSWPVPMDRTYVYLGPHRYVFCRVPGEIKRSRDLRGGRWSWTLTFAQKRSWVGRWSWAEQVGRLLLWVVQVVRPATAVQRTLSYWLCPAQQLKEQLRSAQVAGQWRGDTALTLPLFWRRSTVSPVFFGRFPRSSQSPWPLSHSVPVPNRSSRLVDVKQHKSQKKHLLAWAGLA